jgi:hypothetical protein
MGGLHRAGSTCGMACLLSPCHNATPHNGWNGRDAPPRASPYCTLPGFHVIPGLAFPTHALPLFSTPNLFANTLGNAALFPAK